MLMPPWEIQDRFTRFVSYASIVMFGVSLSMVFFNLPGKIFSVIVLTWAAFAFIDVVRLWRQTRKELRYVKAIAEADLSEDLPGEVQEEINVGRARRYLERRP